MWKIHTAKLVTVLVGPAMARFPQPRHLLGGFCFYGITMDSKVSITVGKAQLSIEKKYPNARIELIRGSGEVIGLNMTYSELGQFLLASVELFIGFDHE
jgi:hypothetical protein